MRREGGRKTPLRVREEKTNRRQETLLQWNDGVSDIKEVWDATLRKTFYSAADNTALDIEADR